MILVYDCYQPQFCVIYGYILCCCSEGNHSYVPLEPLEGRGPGTLLRSKHEKHGIVCFQCWWSCFWHDNVSLLLGITVIINQDRWCGCLQFSGVYCLHWVFLSPCLFTLSSLISVCGSLPPPAIIHLPPAAIHLYTCNIISPQHSHSSPVSRLQPVVCCVFVSVISTSSHFCVHLTGVSNTVKPHSVSCNAMFVWQH